MYYILDNVARVTKVIANYFSWFSEVDYIKNLIIKVII